MKKIDRNKAQEEFNQLVNLIEKSRSKNSPEEIELAAKTAIEFISKLGGTEIAQWLMYEGLSPLPETIFTKSSHPAEIGLNAYMQRSLAKFVLAFQEVLEAAHINAGVISSDLIQMGLDKGDDPNILTNPNKKKKIRKPRVIKNAASMQIVEIIFHEVEAQIKLTKHATGEEVKKSDLEKADISDTYFEVRAAFENSPAYKVLSTLYDNDKGKLEQFYRRYAETYVKSGIEQAEQGVMNEMSSLVEAKLKESLPKASNTALYNFTESILSLTDQMFEKRPDLCPSYFNGAVDSKEFSIFFANELDSVPREKYLSSITDIVLSAKNNPGAYALSKEEIEQKLEAPYLKAFAAVGDRASYLIDGSSPKSPGDVCIAIRAIYGEVLQLSSPDREDILRHMFSSE